MVAYGFWLLAVAVMHAAGRVMRGQGTFSRTFRVLGFLQAITLIELLRLIPVLDTPVNIVANVLSFFGVWLGAAVAQRLRGWRTVFLPIVFFVTLVLGVLAVLMLAGGLDFALETLLGRLGLK